VELWHLDRLRRAESSVDQLLQAQDQARLQFGRRLAGEGGEEDSLGLDAVHQDPLEHQPDQGVRLTGPGASDDPQRRSIIVLESSELVPIQWQLSLVGYADRLQEVPYTHHARPPQYLLTKWQARTCRLSRSRRHTRPVVAGTDIDPLPTEKRVCSVYGGFLGELECKHQFADVGGRTR